MVSLNVLQSRLKSEARPFILNARVDVDKSLLYKKEEYTFRVLGYYKNNKGHTRAALM